MNLLSGKFSGNLRCFLFCSFFFRISSFSGFFGCLMPLKRHFF